MRARSRSPRSIVSAPARTLRSGLARRSKARMDSARIALRNPLSGRRVCLPAVSTSDNGWTVPRSFEVRQLLGELVFVVGDDGRVDSEGERFRITAVMSSEFGGPAPASFELWECASAEGVVQVCFGARVQEFLGLPFEERELLDLSGVPTPSSPSCASGSG